MACNCGSKINKLPCCCSTGDALVCTTTTCADAQPCNETIESDCILYTGLTYDCAEVTTGMTATQVINAFLVALDLVCVSTTTVSPFYVPCDATGSATNFNDFTNGLSERWQITGDPSENYAYAIGTYANSGIQCTALVPYTDKSTTFTACYCNDGTHDVDVNGYQYPYMSFIIIQPLIDTTPGSYVRVKWNDIIVYEVAAGVVNVPPDNYYAPPLPTGVCGIIKVTIESRAILSGFNFVLQIGYD